MMKNCPRCYCIFECRNDRIMECDCLSVPISADDRLYIGERYDGCLCLNCLQELKKERQRLLAAAAVPGKYNY
ncbi:MAG TPA: cysteine-rich CWC family protein [Bacteroidales bacterium]|nr:cysteine-rich CWC family protein [Bacteroidales bacterium]